MSRSVSLDYYGGSYIDDDGNLVVCVTSDYEIDSNIIQTYTNNDNILIKIVDYAYDTLLQEQERITELYIVLRDAYKNNDTEKNSVAELLDSLSGSYICEERNRLVVEIKELNKEKINVFENEFSKKPYIEFENGSYSSTTSSSGGLNVETRDADEGTTGGSSTYWYPGCMVYSKNGGMSVGYPIYFVGTDGKRKYGFITAGHGIETGDYVYNLPITSNAKKKIGICVKSQNSGYVDAAIVQLDDTYSMINRTLYGGKVLSTTYNNTLVKGAKVYKEGAKTGLKVGEVLSTSFKAYEDTGLPVIQDTIKISALNLEGDSGGVVYDGNGKIIGSVSGSYFTDLYTHTENTFDFCVVIKTKNTLNSLGGSLS